MRVPAHLLYSKDHEWLSTDGACEATVGVTAYAGAWR